MADVQQYIYGRLMSPATIKKSLCELPDAALKTENFRLPSLDTQFS
jgi:hypothetical protein